MLNCGVKSRNFHKADPVTDVYLAYGIEYACVLHYFA